MEQSIMVEHPGTSVRFSRVLRRFFVLLVGASALMGTGCKNEVGGLRAREEAPVVTIESPANGDVFQLGEVIDMVALVEDADDSGDVLRVDWSTHELVLAIDEQLDGELRSRISTKDLTPGPHEILVTARDDDGKTGEAEPVTIMVLDGSENPIISFVTPADNATVNPDVPTQVTVQVSDTQDDATALSATLMSDLSGQLCTFVISADGTGSCSPTFAQAGTHTLTAMVEDSDGNSGVDVISVNVAKDAEVPQITIIAPTAGENFAVGAQVTMRAHVADPQDGPEALRASVRSDLDGALCELSIGASGQGTCVTPLEFVGLHGLTFTVIDSDGHTASAQVNVLVGNGGTGPGCTDTADVDGDGYSVCDGDCDDMDPTRHPFADDSDGDGIDHDCDGYAWWVGPWRGCPLEACGNVYESRDMECHDSAGFVVPSSYCDDYPPVQSRDCFAPACPESACVNGNVVRAYELQHGDLIISEAMIASSGCSSDDQAEYFEIYNNTDCPVDLNGLVIMTLSDSWTVPYGNRIEGKSFQYLTQDPGLLDQCYDMYDGIEYFTHLIFDNSGDQIRLETEDMGLVDHVFFHKEKIVPGRAMVLDRNHMSAEDNDRARWWCSSNTPLAAGDYGSPGAENRSCP